MQLLSLLDRAEKTQYLLLLEFAKAEKPMTVSELEKKITGSSKYLAKQLQLLQERCEAYPAIHWRKYIDGWVFTCEPDFKYSDLAYDYVTESINYQLLIQLFQEGSLNFYQVLADYAISEPTYYRRVRELNQLLQEFQLKISNGRLLGPELQIRYFFYQLMLKALPFDGHPVKTAPVVTGLLDNLQEQTWQIKLQAFECHAFSLLLTIFARRWRIPHQGDLREINDLLPQLSTEPLQQQLAAAIKTAQPKMPTETLQREASLLFIFMMSFHMLPHHLPIFEDTYQRFDEGQLLHTAGDLINRYCQELMAIFSQMFTGTPMKLDDNQLIRYCFVQMAYFLQFFHGGYLNYDVEEYLSLKNVVVLEKLQIGSRQALEGVYTKLHLPFNFDDSHTHLMYNRFLGLFINIYQRHPSPLLLGFNYQGWPLARDTLHRYLTDMMKAQHVVVDHYQPGQKYDIIVTNLADPQIEKDSYATFVISDVITDKEMKRILEFISFRREHFMEFEQILAYL